MAMASRDDALITLSSPEDEEPNPFLSPPPLPALTSAILAPPLPPRTTTTPTGTSSNAITGGERRRGGSSSNGNPFAGPQPQQVAFKSNSEYTSSTEQYCLYIGRLSTGGTLVHGACTWAPKGLLRAPGGVPNRLRDPRFSEACTFRVRLLVRCLVNALFRHGRRAGRGNMFNIRKSVAIFGWGAVTTVLDLHYY